MKKETLKLREKVMTRVKAAKEVKQVGNLLHLFGGESIKANKKLEEDFKELREQLLGY